MMDIVFLMQKMHSSNNEFEKESVKKEIENMFSLLSDEEKETVRKKFLSSLHKKVAEGKRLIYHVDEYLKLADVSKYEASFC